MQKTLQIIRPSKQETNSPFPQQSPILPSNKPKPVIQRVPSLLPEIRKCKFSIGQEPRDPKPLRKRSDKANKFLPTHIPRTIRKLYSIKSKDNGRQPISAFRSFTRRIIKHVNRHKLVRSQFHKSTKVFRPVSQNFKRRELFYHSVYGAFKFS
jgi:hypothetical protein